MLLFSASSKSINKKTDFVLGRFQGELINQVFFYSANDFYYSVGVFCSNSLFLLKYEVE